MLCLCSLSSVRIIPIRRNPTISATSFLLSKRFSLISRKTHIFLASPLRQAVSSSSSPSFSRSVTTGASSSSSMRIKSKKAPESIHEITVKDAGGTNVDLSTYKGKVLLIVNVASQCGLTTTNYTELTQLYDKFKDQGLEILAFPCNQFGGQEPGSNKEIVDFACIRFKAEYPIFDKVDVNGDKTSPIYKYLKSTKCGLFKDNIKWNFTKFLIDKEGNVVDRYAPTTSPLSMENDIKKLLGISA